MFPGWSEVSLSVPIVRRSARAVLVDDHDRLVLIKRSRPGAEGPYWTTAGGGVEPGDSCQRQTVRRELFEELGATAVVGEQVFLESTPTEVGLKVAHFYLARLLTLDFEARTGLEPTDPSWGSFEVDRKSFAEAAGIDLRPASLREYLVSNARVLLADLPPVNADGFLHVLQ